MAGAARTIFALSTGAPPAAIGIVRISGPDAGAALDALAGGRRPEPRHATLATLRDPATGGMLDRALLLWFPGPRTATGEDLAELHLHGGRAIVAAVLATLAQLNGLRHAEAGEFTRRALEHGRIDLAEAEALADLLRAETEAERRAAIVGAEGHYSRTIAGWRSQLLGVVAAIEADIEFAEDDGGIVATDVTPALDALTSAMADALAAPLPERTRDGLRVVIAGPPNAGKSSLLNALVARQAALVSDVPGTTRDVIEVPVALGGRPFLICDTAGLRESSDPVEQLGIASARNRIAASDILLWLGSIDETPRHDRCITVATKIDAQPADPRADVQTSSIDGSGIALLCETIQASASSMPQMSRNFLPLRERSEIVDARLRVQTARDTRDPLITSQLCREAIVILQRTEAWDMTEQMLDQLFSKFCVGK